MKESIYPKTNRGENSSPRTHATQPELEYRQKIHAGERSEGHNIMSTMHVVLLQPKSASIHPGQLGTNNLFTFIPFPPLYLPHHPFASFSPSLFTLQVINMNGKRAAGALDGATSSTQFRCKGEKSRRMEEETERKQGAASPCAACKLLRRRCGQDCVFAPHFPADEPQKFATVHKVFGASNVSKLLQEIAVQHRSDAASSLVYEANARIRDPVYGCVDAICSLQSQIQVLQAQLAIAQAKLFHLRISRAACLARRGISQSPAATESSCSGSSFISSPEPNQLMEPHTAAAEFLYGVDMVLQEENNLREPPISSC
ncbi:LOB domain-containing protein 4-like [Canna indica]|uniref:LOB domain-containing protein 4-like n=1 Tax=Canna indica TaxID=4628 RepID=A0AAQ3PWH2_9LILI|nr:LOB domain-containing protein 4-like [Canna indica]